MVCPDSVRCSPYGSGAPPRGCWLNHENCRAILATMRAIHTQDEPTTAVPVQTARGGALRCSPSGWVALHTVAPARLDAVPEEDVCPVGGDDGAAVVATRARPRAGRRVGGPAHGGLRAAGRGRGVRPGVRGGVVRRGAGRPA